MLVHRGLTTPSLFEGNVLGNTVCVCVLVCGGVGGGVTYLKILQQNNKKTFKV